MANEPKSDAQHHTLHEIFKLKHQLHAAVVLLELLNFKTMTIPLVNKGTKI